MRMKRFGMMGLMVLTLGIGGCEKESSPTPTSSNTTARLATKSGGKFKVLTASQLPASIQTYLQSHYAGATIRQSGQGPRGKYGVAIQTGDVFQLLLFDAQGGFLRETQPRREGGQRLETADLPNDITAYLTGQYGGYQIQGAGKGPRGNFVVVIKQGETRKLLIFNQSGSFLRELSR